MLLHDPGLPASPRMRYILSTPGEDLLAFRRTNPSAYAAANGHSLIQMRQGCVVEFVTTSYVLDCCWKSALY
jgi:hypothetical protein